MKVNEGPFFKENKAYVHAGTMQRCALESQENRSIELISQCAQQELNNSRVTE
jgi:hypothetical protein